MIISDSGAVMVIFILKRNSFKEVRCVFHQENLSSQAKQYFPTFLSPTLLQPILSLSIHCVASPVVLPRERERKGLIGFLSWKSLVEWACVDRELGGCVSACFGLS